MTYFLGEKSLGDWRLYFDFVDGDIETLRTKTVASTSGLTRLDQHK
jgi:hypothetical protein